MRTLHHYMLLTALMSSALSFKLASACLTWAQYHKGKYNLATDKAMNAYMGVKPAPVAHRTIQSPNTWLDAEPECPMCGNVADCDYCMPVTKAEAIRREAARRGLRVVDYPEK